MKTIIGVLLTLAAICLLWILFIEFSDFGNSSRPSSSQSENSTGSASNQDGSTSAAPLQPAPSRSAATSGQPAASSSQKIQQLRSLAARHNVEILSLRDFGSGVELKLRARDHISTGDFLDSATQGGALVRNFDQGPLSTQVGRDGTRLYLSEFKFYW